MLKSTHKPLPPAERLPLPQPWTEHVAPTGHPYYYNPQTRQSTYTRPSMQSYEQVQSHHPTESILPSLDYPTQFPHAGSPKFNPLNNLHGGQSRHYDDRPKSKHVIPGCGPWLLIKTHLGRRFVHNPVTKESFWKFPKDIIGGVVDLDIQERTRGSDGNSSPIAVPAIEKTVLGLKRPIASNSDPTTPVDNVSIIPLCNVVNSTFAKSDEEPMLGNEYEEIEETGSEIEDDDSLAKRTKSEEDADWHRQKIEFNEEDMARQLAEMGHIHSLDPGEYDDYNAVDEVWEDGAEGLELSEEDAAASFRDLLDDFRVNPYTTWETVVSEAHIIEDDRYTLLPNMKRRKVIFSDWSASRIKQHKSEREQQLMQDPRVAYLTFLGEHATPKLFWPEFRRKYKKEPAMKDSKLSDKDRETLYRSHVNRITKLPEETLKIDLRTLLKSIPVSPSWNRSSRPDEGVPLALATDVRFISLKPSVRDIELQSYIESLPNADEIKSSFDMVVQTEQDQKRERSEFAMGRREKEVGETKERQQRELQLGRRRLKEEERGLARATQVGKEGLLRQMDTLRDVA